MMESDNTLYLFAAYAVFLGGIGLYLASLAVRRRNLQREAETISRIAEQHKEEDESRAAADSQADSVSASWSS